MLGYVLNTRRPNFQLLRELSCLLFSGLSVNTLYFFLLSDFIFALSPPLAFSLSFSFLLNLCSNLFLFLPCEGRPGLSPLLSLRLSLYLPFGTRHNLLFLSFFMFFDFLFPDFPHFLIQVFPEGVVQMAASLEEMGHRLLHHHVCQMLSAALVTDLASQAFSLTRLATTRATAEP